MVYGLLKQKTRPARATVSMSCGVQTYSRSASNPNSATASRDFAMNGTSTSAPGLAASSRRHSTANSRPTSRRRRDNPSPAGDPASSTTAGAPCSTDPMSPPSRLLAADSQESTTMPNRTLSPNELASANALLVEVRARLKSLAGGDSALLFAYRRKVGAYLRRAREADPPQDAEGAQTAPASGSVRRMRRPAAGSIRRTGSPGRTPRIHGRQYETALPRMRHQDSGSTRVQVSGGDDSRRRRHGTWPLSVAGRFGDPLSARSAHGTWPRHGQPERGDLAARQWRVSPTRLSATAILHLPQHGIETP